MPNQAGSEKRRRRNEKLKKAEVTSDATPAELPLASGLEASTSASDGLSSESKGQSTGICAKDSTAGGTEPSVEENIGADDKKNEIEQDEEKKTKKKKKKKKKTSQSDDNDKGTCTKDIDSGTDTKPSVKESIGTDDEKNDIQEDKKKTKKKEKKTSQPTDENSKGVCAKGIDSTAGTEPSVKEKIVDEENEIQQGEEKNEKARQSDEIENNQANDPAVIVCLEEKGAAEEREMHSELKEDIKFEDSCDEKGNVFGSNVNTCDEIVAKGDCADVSDEIEAHEREDIVKERYFDRLTRLLIGVGATCLRQYFLKIHPTWNNQPTDASALKKGALKLQNHEKAKFYTGDIKEWDVSLLIRVLRYSHVSSVELKHNPNIDDALDNIKEIRNEIVAHAKDKKLSESDFKKSWEKLKLNLLAIGGSEEEIDETVIDYTDLGLEQYRQLLLEEIAHRKFSEQDSGETKENSSTTEEKEPLEIHPDPQWDDWLKFCCHMNSFKSSQTQFILLTDVMAQTDLENFKVLAAIPWKMVIDFDPSSEDNGLYKIFNSQTSLQQVLSPFTPGEISKVGILALPKQIDPKRTQWLYANGRNEDSVDSKPKAFSDWEQQSVMAISMFFACCVYGDMFDVQKPIRCLLLPMSETSLPFIEVTLKRLIESFHQYDISLASIDNSCKSISLSKKVRTFQLSSVELHNGLKHLFNVTEDPQRYEMPCFQSGIRFPFLQKDYIYMSEYLELFYIGCQNKFINSNDEEEEQKANEEEYRKCFLSGNLISFLSLFFNHDAKREIEKNLEIHIQRMLNQRLKQTGIVQIVHPPGTGGSTIARRVLWNLHESFPCAAVRLSSQAEFDEDSNFINEVSSRVSILEDKCGIPPIVLIDGHSQWRIHALSNRILRTLNSRGKKAVILECHRGSKHHANAEAHNVFYVDARLEVSSADLREFKEKFNESNRSACRVFHFPLLSMIDEFRDNLVNIVTNTLTELDDLEKDIAAFVAFLQLYAEHPTPAILLYEVFQSRLSISKGIKVTYESIKECFSSCLLNLMVHQKKQKTDDDCLTHYTLQHHVVATLLFEKYRDIKKETLYEYVYKFLQYPISNLKRFVYLYCDLFLFNRGGNRKNRFSVLVEQLRNCNPKEAATVLRKAAEIIPDPRAYGHAARFYAKMSTPKFKEAEELIAAGIKLSESHGRVKSIRDSKGVVHSLKLKHKIRCKQVKDICNLEELAQKALDAFHSARDFPPTFPFPLMGEVDVWISCIQWITQDQSGEAEKAVKFIISMAPPFFRTCIGDSFYLLELVDNMIMSTKMIADPDEIRERVQHLRILLMSAVKPGINTVPRRNISNLWFGIDEPHGKLNPFSQKESRRIRARMLLSLFRREQQSFEPGHMKELVKLLEEMVVKENDFSFASHFLQLCLLGDGPRTYDLDRGWKVCRDWLESPECWNPMRYYYSMVIAFMQILNGLGPDGYFAEYKSLLKQLKDKSRGLCKRNQSLHFLKKNGDEISQLLSHQSLFSDEPSYNAEDSDVVKNYWMVDSRRKLKECTGRLRVKVEGSKKVTKIELLEGDIELYVGKYAEIGIPGKDFDKDAKVYFVVSFNLIGPVANGITFYPAVDQKNNGAP